MARSTQHLSHSLTFEWVNAMRPGAAGRTRRSGRTGQAARPWRTVRHLLPGAAALLLAVVTAACGGGGTSSSVTTQPSTAPKAGGSLTVLEGAGFAGDWPAGLDPATNINGAADQSYMDAIYGEPFELGPKGKIINDLATRYKYYNGATTISSTLPPWLKVNDDQT